MTPHPGAQMRLILALAVTAFVSSACAGTGASLPAAPTGAPDRSALLDPSSPEMNVSAPERFKVLFETTQGDFVVEVNASWAPAGAARFYNLVRHGYYDGVRFFRVLPSFVVQFGLSGEPEVAAVWREARIPDDTVAATEGVSNERGYLTYAMAGPDTRTTQLFINLADNSRLDPMGFTPFGMVTGGMDVVERLYSGYGEGAPAGAGPSQSRIQEEGEAYLSEEFPRLDRILRARIIQHSLAPLDPSELP